MKIHYNCDSAIKHKWTAKCYLIFFSTCASSVSKPSASFDTDWRERQCKKIYIALHTVY